MAFKKTPSLETFDKLLNEDESWVAVFETTDIPVNSSNN